MESELTNLARQLPEYPCKILNRNILCIEDDAPILMNMVKELNDMGYNAEGSTNIKNALIKMRHHRFGIVILDLNLSGVIDINKITYLKKIYPCQQIVIYSCYNDPNTIVKCINSGASKYIRKTIDDDNIPAIIKSFYGD